MEINNLGSRETDKCLHHEMLPNDLRMLIIGQSGCGKTNLAMNLIMKYISWSHAYIITMTPRQPIYNVLRDFNDREEQESRESCVTFVSPDELEPDLFESMAPQSLVLFDDFMLVKNQEFPSLIFSQGRHRQINAIYISQKFTETELVIRQNANILVMFSVDSKSREYVYNTYASADMELKDFKAIKLLNRDFLSICLSHERDKKYTKNFSHVVSKRCETL